MDVNWVQILNLVLTFGIACAYAYKSRQDKEAQCLVLEGIKASKEVSVVNQQAIVSVARQVGGVAQQGVENAQAIEHTRIQNVNSAVQTAALTQDVKHLHICVETKVTEVKEAVARVPDAVKEVVPAVIKEVVPDVIKEVVPEAIKTTLT